MTTAMVKSRARDKIHQRSDRIGPASMKRGIGILTPGLLKRPQTALVPALSSGTVPLGMRWVAAVLLLVTAGCRFVQEIECAKVEIKMLDGTEYSYPRGMDDRFKVVAYQRTGDRVALTEYWPANPLENPERHVFEGVTTVACFGQIDSSTRWVW